MTPETGCEWWCDTPVKRRLLTRPLLYLCSLGAQFCSSNTSRPIIKKGIGCRYVISRRN